MQSTISEFLSSRIDDIAQEVLANNTKYALAHAACKHLLDTIDPIICSKTDLQISAGDCFAFRTYLENDMTRNAILEEALYRQGYLDCIRLLSALGMLA